MADTSAAGHLELVAPSEPTPRRTCQEPGESCPRAVTARGLCRMHYLRAYRARTHTKLPTRATRSKVECPADHPHDAATCWAQHGCRCPSCVHDRAMERQRKRNRLRAYGRTEPETTTVPAGPVRAHVEQLHKLGLGYERIGHAAGVGAGVMMDLIYGRRGLDDREPIVTIRKTHADALLALDPETVDFAFVDSTGTVRRLRALVAIGWNETQLAEKLGVNRNNFWHLLHENRTRVTATTRAAVAALFRELWQHPQTGPRADRARQLAKTYRWVGPLAWDDIDDIAEQPQGVARARDGRYTTAEALDDVAFLLELGESAHQAAAIVGKSMQSIAAAAANARRDEVYSAFDRALRKREAA